MISELPALEEQRAPPDVLDGAAFPFHDGRTFDDRHKVIHLYLQERKRRGLI
jgi:hypothetical protein